MGSSLLQKRRDEEEGPPVIDQAELDAIPLPDEFDETVFDTLREVFEVIYLSDDVYKGELRG